MEASSIYVKEHELLAKGFFITAVIDNAAVKKIFDYLHNESYWAKNIPYERMAAALSNSMCFAVYKGSEFAGFARVISDKATFAYLCDVFVMPDFRGQGLSKWLVSIIVKHPELQGLRRWVLATKDAHDLYVQFGFKRFTNHDSWMEILQSYENPTIEVAKNRHINI